MRFSLFVEAWTGAGNGIFFNSVLDAGKCLCVASPLTGSPVKLLRKLGDVLFCCVTPYIAKLFAV